MLVTHYFIMFYKRTDVPTILSALLYIYKALIKTYFLTPVIMLYLILKKTNYSKKWNLPKMSKMIIKIVLLTIVLIVVGFFISGPIFTNSETKNKIEQMRSQDNIEIETIDFKHSEFLSLPFIVQKYLKNSIITKSKGNQPMLPLRLIGEARVEPGSNWIPTEVTFYYSLSVPAFVWVATSEQFSFLWNKTINTYINGVAKSKNKFLSSVSTEEIEGVKLDQSYFLFYLLNSVLSPTVLLPSQNIQWTALGKLKAEVVMWHKSEHGKAVFYFNEFGSVERIEVDDMFLPNRIDTKKEKFTLHLANYKEVDGNKIPTYLEYQWNLSGGDFTFNRFNIVEVE